MNLDAEKIRLMRDGERLQVVIDGVSQGVERVARAFPKSDPEHYVGLLDAEGHEIGLIENPHDLDEASRELLESELKKAYFVPTVQEILSVIAQGTGSQWQVHTDDGEFEFRVQDRDALDGSEAPAITVTDENGKRYYIENYWTLSRESREMMRDLLPDEILRRRTRSVSVRR